MTSRRCMPVMPRRLRLAMRRLVHAIRSDSRAVPHGFHSAPTAGRCDEARYGTCGGDALTRRVAARQASARRNQTPSRRVFYCCQAGPFLTEAGSVPQALAPFQATRKPVTDELRRISCQGWTEGELDEVFPGQWPWPRRRCRNDAAPAGRRGAQHLAPTSPRCPWARSRCARAGRPRCRRSRTGYRWARCRTCRRPRRAARCRCGCAARAAGCLSTSMAGRSSWAASRPSGSLWRVVSL